MYLPSETCLLLLQLLIVQAWYLPTSVFSYSINNSLREKSELLTQNYILNPHLNELLIQGMEKGIQGDYQGAIADFTEILRQKPDEVEAYYNRGLAYAKIRDYQRAITDFNQALTLHQNIAEIYLERAKVYLQLGNRQEAITDLKTAKRLFNQQKNPARYQEIQRLLQEVSMTNH